MKILLAIDGSTASEAALDSITARPWPARSSVEIVSVVEPAHLWTNAHAAAESAQRADELVEQAMECLHARDFPAKGVTLFGNPKTVIVERARQSGADFIFLGARGSSGLKRFLLGSAATGILRDAPCSVEIVRGEGGAVKRLLLATDGSEFSERAASSIAQRPWPEGTEVRVVSVVELTLPPGHAFFEPPVDTAFLEDERARAMRRCQEAIGRAREILAGMSTSESISVLLAPPRAIILNEAAEWGADLIVLGSHGHGRIDRLLLGSVSESVAMHAGCSVEVIRGS